MKLFDNGCIYLNNALLNSRIIYHIMANTYVEDSYKARLKESAKFGRVQRGLLSCKVKYPCDNLDKESAIFQQQQTFRHH